MWGDYFFLEALDLVTRGVGLGTGAGHTDLAVKAGGST